MLPTNSNSVSLSSRFATRVSLQVFGLEPTTYAEVAIAADREGFDTLWLAEHVVTPLEITTPYPYHPSGSAGYTSETPLVDVLVAAAHLAGLTERIRLASGVLILPLRHPVLAARAIATLQSMSNGRFALGVGAGWLREEFDVIDASFERRGARMDEMVEIMRKLWTGEPVEHAGEFYRFEPVQLSPPIDAPPVYFGGSTGPALRRTARLGDGWYGPACDLEASLAVREQIDALRHEEGRDRAFDFAVRLDGPLESGTVARYRDAGFDHVVVGLSQVAPARGAEAAAVARLAELLAG
jgi:probable F420-dependent oxidoreductase